ncbi:hypothetical protein [Candidatus Viadribacter manganicus]|nr:hypothetical protein [Candidatus Viadribacter manganicus]
MANLAAFEGHLRDRSVQSSVPAKFHWRPDDVSAVAKMSAHDGARILGGE